MAEVGIDELRPDSPSAVLDVVAPTLLSSHNFFEQYPQCEEGPLNGETCSVEDYHNIPREYGRYDLVDGVLEARPMSHTGHSRLQHELIRILNERQRDLRRHDSRLASLSIRMESKVRLRKKTFLIPDIVVGESIANDGPSKFSFDCTQGGDHRSACRPKLVIEITSGNAARDHGTKMRLYQKARIPEYWIVDRSLNVVQRLTLRNEKYIKEEFKIGETIESYFFGSLSVDKRRRARRNAALLRERLRTSGVAMPAALLSVGALPNYALVPGQPMAENFCNGMPDELSRWLYKQQRMVQTKKKRYFKLASQVLSSHVRNISPPSWEQTFIGADVDGTEDTHRITVTNAECAVRLTTESASDYYHWLDAFQKAS
eukprot:IDg11991t1